MNGVTSRALGSDPEMRRALQLDALASILPMERRDRLAELLTGEDAATLKHLAQEGIGENTLRALASDLAHLESWALAAAGRPLPWPAPDVAVRNDPTWPHQDGRRRRRGKGASGRAAGRGPARMAAARGHQQEGGLPCHRSLGGHRGKGADAAVGQLDGVAPLRDGGARGEGVFGARVGGPDI